VTSLLLQRLGSTSRYGGEVGDERTEKYSLAAHWDEDALETRSMTKMLLQYHGTTCVADGEK
jgi:hypothetical protein